MLMQTAKMLRPGGRCFVVLPAHCISNSRYLKFALFKRLLSRIGLIVPETDGYQMTEKFFLCVAVRGDEIKGTEGFETEALYKRKLCRGGSSRNNFCILLPPATAVTKSKRAEVAEGEEKVLPDKNLKTTSNQRRRARQKKLLEAKRQKKQGAEEAAPAEEAPKSEYVDF
jgi:hypothetical protein